MELPKSFNKLNIISHLITTTPYSIVFPLMAQYIAFGEIHWDIYPRMWIISYVFGFICGAFIPLGKPSSMIASYCRFKTGSYGWYIFSSIIFQLLFSIFMGLVTGWINCCIFDTQNFWVVTGNAFRYLCYYWIVSIVICAITDHNLNRFACYLCKEKYYPF